MRKLEYCGREIDLRQLHYTRHGSYVGGYPRSLCGIPPHIANSERVRFTRQLEYVTCVDCLDAMDAEGNSAVVPRDGLAVIEGTRRPVLVRL